MKISKPYKGPDGRSRVDVRLRGYDLIHEPLLNKGTGFTHEEREAFGLRGMLPSATSTMDLQVKRIHESIQSETKDFQKYIVLSDLQDRNEHLYYRVLSQHLEEMMPLVYTPTVGEATQRYSRAFRRGRGVWVTPDHKGNIRKLLQQVCDQREVSLLVVTDSESILGIGDQGAGGMAISVGKLSLYCVGAGIHPSATLPICLDVGTNNQALLEDEFYLGWPHARLTGSDYREIVAEFVAAVKEVFPGAMVQWEDFRKDNALEILETYRDVLPSFNDDIQGTGAVALAGVLSALRITGEPFEKQRVVIYGAGAAGLGIARQLRAAFRQSGLEGVELQRACAVLDSRGLLVNGRAIRDAYKKELAWDNELAADYGLTTKGDLGLESVVRHYKPTVLIGSSGQAGAFSEAIVKEMASHVERPIILPFSNPTSLAEARPAGLYKWTKGRCLLATGSPFDDVQYEGQTFRVGQGNNVFIFPGVGMATIIAGAKRISDSMISAAAAALAETVTEEELAQGLLFPAISRLREVSLAVTQSVIKTAMEEGVCTLAGEDLVQDRLADALWEPEYVEYVPA